MISSIRKEIGRENRGNLRIFNKEIDYPKLAFQSQILYSSLSFVLKFMPLFIQGLGAKLVGYGILLASIPVASAFNSYYAKKLGKRHLHDVPDVHTKVALFSQPWEDIKTNVKKIGKKACQLILGHSHNQAAH